MKSCVTHHMCDCTQERIENLEDRIEKLRETLKFISCEGYDDADYWAEDMDNLVEGIIMIANRARSVLSADDLEASK